MSFFNNIKTENIHLDFPHINKNIKIYIKREDLIHPVISGNKFRKLKYNLNELKNKNKSLLITFGGAFSNHLLAEKIKKYSNDTIHEDLQLLANFSHAGHRSSGNKNYMLLAVNVYLYLMDNTIGFINIFI